MTITIYCIIAICVAAVIGAVIGIFKKATGVTFWGVCVLLSVLVARLVAKLVSVDNSAYSWLVLGITVGASVIFTLLFGSFKKFLEKRVEHAKEYSHYKNKDKLDENEEYILNAVDNKDKRQYRKLRKKRRKIKDSARGWGIVNRLLGFIAGGVNWLVAVGSVMAAVILFIDLSGINGIKDNAIFKELLESDGWVNIGAKLSMDVILVGTVIIAVKSGFKNGISHAINVIIVLGMLGGFGYASWAIACSVDCTGLQNGLLAQLTSINADISLIVARVIVAAIIFLLSLIIVIITGIMLPKLINKFREDSDTFYVIDGVLGAVVSTAVLLAVFVALGGIAYTLNDLSFMSSFNSYESQSVFANAFYKFNPLKDVFSGLPVRGWFGT